MRARNASDEKTVRTPFQKLRGPFILRPDLREGRGAQGTHAGQLLVHWHVHQERHHEAAPDVEHGGQRYQ